MSQGVVALCLGWVNVGFSKPLGPWPDSQDTRAWKTFFDGCGQAAGLRFTPCDRCSVCFLGPFCGQGTGFPPRAGSSISRKPPLPMGLL